MPQEACPKNKKLFLAISVRDTLARYVPSPTTFTKRFLPHWQPQDQSIFITWRLYGSLPMKIAARKENISGE